MSSVDIGFAHASGTAASYTAHVVDFWDETNWTGTPPTPFQRREWLNAFYAAIDNDAAITPLLVTVRNAQGELALRLPLIRHWKKKLLVIEFADLSMTDYNAPILGPGAPQNTQEARICWRALKKALPYADLLSFQKMPLQLDGKPNPFSFLSGAHGSPANGNPLTIGEDWDAFRNGWERTFRKDLERSWRVFKRNPEAEFRAITNTQEALQTLHAMETQQRQRMQDVGANYQLDQPIQAEFYRRLVKDNAGGGYVVLTALIAGDEVVAALLGVRDRERYIMIRVCHQDGTWSNCSPGRLIIERTMAHLHAEGCRIFDFSVGNYAYKRRFGVERLPLMDFTMPFSLRGIPETARAKAAAITRQHPKLHARIRKMLGRPVSREET